MGKIYIKGNYGFLERHLFSLVTSPRVEALSALPNILYVLIGNKHQKCHSERERESMKALPTLYTHIMNDSHSEENTFSFISYAHSLI